MDRVWVLRIWMFGCSGSWIVLGLSDVGCLVVQDVGSFLVFRMLDRSWFFGFSDIDRGSSWLSEDIGLFSFADTKM
jgi:hypothetical protein